MFINNISFCVEFSDFAEGHYCKDFSKRYTKKQWIETRKTIIATLERAYAFQQTSRIDNIKYSQEHRIGIFKLDFAVAGTNFSPKKSGNRVIFSLNRHREKDHPTTLLNLTTYIDLQLLVVIPNRTRVYNPQIMQ